MIGPVLDVRGRGTGAVGLALLSPVALSGLDHDPAVGRDPVATAQLTQAHPAGDELALESLAVADPVQSGRLRLSRPPADARRDEGLPE